MTTRLRDFLCARAMLLAVAAILPVTAGAADDAPWPRGKPITWLVGYPPGGTVDVMARAIANKLTERTGQPVVIENRAGASGMIALQAAARAPADGYTMITVPGPDLFKQKVPEIGAELSAVAMIAQGPMVLVGSGTLPSGDLKALLQDIRREPNRWSYGTSGIGTSQHLAGELINSMAGTSMRHVPYRGGAAAANDVVGGQLPLAILGLAPVLGHVKSGRLKAYAVTGSQRIDALPDVPTMQEAGIGKYDASQWYVVAVPRGTAPDRIAQLNGWITAIAASADFKPVLTASGAIAAAGTPEQTQNFVVGDLRRWNELAKNAKIELE
jgi:tripartite-type tricarboxylate transporter receptor subunit TctC